MSALTRHAGSWADEVGCFVPAESAEFKIIHQIFSRMGFDDNIEYNASSFVYEMQEMQYILRSVGPHSLVLIDELCRSTDYEEGTAVAWVLCEQLLQTSAFTFFTTHYLTLTKLQTLYCNVTNHQMVTEEAAEGRLKYTHRLAPGVTRVMLYGLKLAQTSALPVSVLQRAKDICDNLAQNKLAEPIHIEGKTEMEEDDEYIEELLNLVDHNFTMSEVRKVRMKLKERYGMELDSENEAPSENETPFENECVLNTNGQNINTENQTNSHHSEPNQDIPSSREPSIPLVVVSNDLEIRHGVIKENSMAMMEIINANNQEVTPKRSVMIPLSHQGSTIANENNTGNIRKPPCRSIESSSPKTPVHNNFSTPVSRSFSRNLLVDQVQLSSKPPQLLSSPEILRGTFSCSNNPLAFTPGTNSAQEPQTPSTRNYLNVRNLQSPKELCEIPESPCLQLYNTKASTSNVKDTFLHEFKTPEVFPSKQRYPSKSSSGQSFPIIYRNSNTEFYPTNSTELELNLGQHFLNADNSAGYHRQSYETPPSLNERFQTLSDVQYPVSAMKHLDNRSNLSEPWQLQRRGSNDKLVTNKYQTNMERLSRRTSTSYEQSTPYIQTRAGSSSLMVEDDRLAAEDLLREMNMDRPPSQTSQSFGQSFLYSLGTGGSNSPMILDLHPDLSNLPRNIGSQSVYDNSGEEFMEE